jgi:hypothetical protein
VVHLDESAPMVMGEDGEMRSVIRTSLGGYQVMGEDGEMRSARADDVGAHDSAAAATAGAHDDVHDEGEELRLSAVSSVAAKRGVVRKLAAERAQLSAALETARAQAAELQAACSVLAQSNL